MLCAIYKSSKKADTYLYLPKRDHFAAVPEALLQSFGQPQFVMLIDLDKRKALAGADLDKVKAALIEPGYYLQLPPPVENLLEQHKKQMNLS